ncbi:MAG: hypothetical protein R2748_26775 [Bryobacterales bacterium]
MRALPRPIDVTLSLIRELGAESWDRAIAAHFPQAEHRIRLRVSAARRRTLGRRTSSVKAA